MNDSDDEQPPEQIAGYMKCADCGRVILEAFGFQTGRRCVNCWKDRHPLATLEVMNQSVRCSAHSVTRYKASKRPKDPKRQGPDPDSRKARTAAWKRLSCVFPEIFAMILDEERAHFGLPPVAHYEPLEVVEAVSKTLTFEEVYDALESSGASDA